MDYGIYPARVLTPEVGHLLRGEKGTYQLGDRFAAGQAGKIYRGTNAETGQSVAIKVSHALDEEDDPRFGREIEFLRTARHPNIVRLLDVGRFPDGRQTVIMELLDHQTLESVMAKRGRLLEPVAVNFGLRTMRAIRYVHELGLVHRDIKPANIAWEEGVGDTPLPKLLDFGLIGPARGRPDSSSRLSAGFKRLTADKILMGTPAYMAPEQALGRSPDSRSDIYGWGISMYECLAGRLPFIGTSMKILQAHLRDPPPPLDHRHVSPGLRLLLGSCLDKNPSLRPSAEEVVAHLIQ